MDDESEARGFVFLKKEEKKVGGFAFLICVRK